MACRSYRQICAVSKALDLVGKRWTLLIVRDLLPGPLSYTALLEGLPGITTNLLAARLKQLSADGLIAKCPAPAGDKSKALYSLTPAGAALAPVISALAIWGRQHGAVPSPDDAVSLRWFLILFRRQYIPRQEGPGPRRWIVQLNHRERHLQLRLGGPEFEGVEGAPMRADLVIDADAAAYSALLFEQGAATGLLESGRVHLTTNPPGEDPAPIWQDFLASFGLAAGPQPDRAEVESPTPSA